jgi:hypothetical protein
MARHFELIHRHGTDTEKQAARDTMETMIEIRTLHPEAEWMPDQQVTVPDVLVRRAKRVAAERHSKAKRWRAGERYGASRSIEDEERTVEAQFALCLLLGLPFGDNLNIQAARADGNCGSNISAFVPKPGNVGLLITEKEKPQRQMFLMLDDGDHGYHCPGWCRAGEYMIDEYQRTFERWDENGRKHTARPYIVPPEMLSPIAEWWR